MKLLLLVALLVPLIAALAPLHNAGLPNTIPDQYLIVLQKNTTVEIRDFHINELKNRGENIIATYHIGTFIGFSAIFSKNTLLEQLQHPNVLWIEADSVVTISDDVFDDAPADDIISQPSATWGIDRVNQRNLPLDGTFTYWSSAGTNVYSYIIDTGILLTHNDLSPRAHFGANYVGDGNDADCNGHGTHVAGTVAGTVYGLAKKSTLVAVKVLNCGGSGSWTGVVSGIQWTAAHRRTNNVKGIANMSLGGAATPTADAAVEAAVADGTNFAIAAGNSNADACNYSPARAPSALTVGATANNDARASFSNYGTCVDIFAPGQSITSAWIGSNTATSTISGTSMAAPHVAGAVALHLGHIETHPSPKEVHDWTNTVATYDVVTNPLTNPNRFLFAPTTD